MEIVKRIKAISSCFKTDFEIHQGNFENVRNFLYEIMINFHAVYIIKNISKIIIIAKSNAE